MKINVYAILKNYFEPEFEISCLAATIYELREHLSTVKPEASGVLKQCRFAIQDEFVNDQYPINSEDHVVIIPPSSGG